MCRTILLGISLSIFFSAPLGALFARTLFANNTPQEQPQNCNQLLLTAGHLSLVELVNLLDTRGLHAHRLKPLTLRDLQWMYQNVSRLESKMFLLEYNPQLVEDYSTTMHELAVQIIENKLKENAFDKDFAMAFHHLIELGSSSDLKLIQSVLTSSNESGRHLALWAEETIRSKEEMRPINLDWINSRSNLLKQFKNLREQQTIEDRTAEIYSFFLDHARSWTWTTGDDQAFIFYFLVHDQDVKALAIFGKALHPLQLSPLIQEKLLRAARNELILIKLEEKNAPFQLIDYKQEFFDALYFISIYGDEKDLKTLQKMKTLFSPKPGSSSEGTQTIVQKNHSSIYKLLEETLSRLKSRLKV